MSSADQALRPKRNELLPRLFAALFGVFLGLCPLKFGNPPIFESWVTPPTNAWELLIGYPWPITWAYGTLGVVAVVGLLVALGDKGRGSRVEGPTRQRPSPAPRPSTPAPRHPTLGTRLSTLLLALPLVWLAWQFLAATQTVDARLTRPTLAHFVACVVCFYLGFLALSRVKRLGWFWAGFLGGFLLVLAVGWEQHFGGLAETRRYFELYIRPQLKDLPPEYLKRMSSNRIFATLFYPNTLAGMVLLWLPMVLGVINRARQRFTAGARWFLLLLAGFASLACLYWSGSKGGWLLMLLLGLIVLLRLPLGKTLKIALVAGVLLAGLTGFFWKYAGFFQKGATSVGARFDYWQAAARTAQARPLLGTGPGTFAIPYQQIKRPESEPTKLVHNDYLEQASDSGLAGMLTYTLLIGGVLIYAIRRGVLASEAFPIWLGLLGWSLQSLFEFSLYIPALAWPAFAFLGLLLARTRKPMDKSQATG